jgi:hypothetical protein
VSAQTGRKSCDFAWASVKFGFAKKKNNKKEKEDAKQAANNNSNIGDVPRVRPGSQAAYLKP